MNTTVLVLVLAAAGVAGYFILRPAITGANALGGFVKRVAEPSSQSQAGSGAAAAQGPDGFWERLSLGAKGIGNLSDAFSGL